MCFLDGFLLECDLRFFGGQANTLGMEEWTLGATLFAIFPGCHWTCLHSELHFWFFVHLVCFSRPGSDLNRKKGIILEHKEEDQD